MVSFFVFEKKSCFFAKQKTIFLISGISLFVNGILQLIGPPICGFVFQMIGSYKSLFTVCLIVSQFNIKLKLLFPQVLGLILLSGSSLWAFMPFINRNKRLKQEQEDQEMENEENLLA
jgi:uncharacterized membrane protein HdeD (DUF308 family)